MVFFVWVYCISTLKCSRQGHPVVGAHVNNGKDNTVFRDVSHEVYALPGKHGFRCFMHQGEIPGEEQDAARINIAHSYTSFIFEHHFFLFP